MARLVDFVGMSARRHVERCLDLAIDVIQRDISHYILNVYDTYVVTQKQQRVILYAHIAYNVGAADIW